MSTVTLIELHDAPCLDPIDIYLKDVATGAGQITVTCFGSAWTAYFGQMGDRTIRQFVLAVDIDYLVGKMGNTVRLKGRKKDLNYLSRILFAVKVQLAHVEPTQPDVKTN